MESPGPRLVPKSCWQSDQDAPQCMGCQIKFSQKFRRHHCRFCGRVFCNNCTNHKLLGQRACVRCFSTHAGAADRAAEAEAMQEQPEPKQSTLQSKWAKVKDWKASMSRSKSTSAPQPSAGGDVGAAPANGLVDRARAGSGVDRDGVPDLHDQRAAADADAASKETVQEFVTGPRAIALHDFASTLSVELSTTLGQSLALRQSIDIDWVLCTNVDGDSGVVPWSYLLVVKGLPTLPAGIQNAAL